MEGEEPGRERRPGPDHSLRGRGEPWEGFEQRNGMIGLAFLKAVAQRR